MRTDRTLCNCIMALVCMLMRACAAWGASDPETARAARALALELGVDGGHDTTSSLRTLARVEGRLTEIHADRTWSVEGIDGQMHRVPQAELNAYQRELAGCG
eukprot:COSAG02_NODE_5732_length_4083_cov_2.870733_4_plen_103_part_00